MKTNFKISMLLIVLMTVPFCVSAGEKVITKEVSISVFQKLNVNNYLRVIFTNYCDGKITIEGTEKAVASVIIDQEGTTLSLSRSESADEAEKVTVYMPSSEMNTLIVSGDATVECETIIHTNVLSLLHKGTGLVKLKSDAGVIQTMATRGGRIAVTGEYTTTVSRMDASNHMIVAYSK